MEHQTAQRKVAVLVTQVIQTTLKRDDPMFS
jgi:hypothetical protein